MMAVCVFLLWQADYLGSLVHLLDLSIFGFQVVLCGSCLPLVG